MVANILWTVNPEVPGSSTEWVLIFHEARLIAHDSHVRSSLHPFGLVHSVPILSNIKTSDSDCIGVKQIDCCNLKMCLQGRLYTIKIMTSNSTAFEDTKEEEDAHVWLFNAYQQQTFKFILLDQPAEYRRSRPVETAALRHITQDTMYRPEHEERKSISRVNHRYIGRSFITLYQWNLN